MQGELRLVLEAHHTERNHHRRYELEVGQDIFGTWTLTVRHGRCGSRCQESVFAAEQSEPLRRVAMKRLRRRHSAKRRIGCEYRIAETHGHEEPVWEDWFPATELDYFATGNYTL